MSNYSVCSEESDCINYIITSKLNKHHNKCSNCNDIRIGCTIQCYVNKSLCTRCCMDNEHQFSLCRICKTKIIKSCTGVCYDVSMCINICKKCYDKSEIISECSICNMKMKYNKLTGTTTYCKNCYMKYCHPI